MYTADLHAHDHPITQECHSFVIDALSSLSQSIKQCLPDLDALLPNFGWVGKDHIRTTLEKTSQHYKADQRIPMQKNFRSCFPTDRIPAKKEPCLTPTLMDEGQARNPNTTYNGYIMEFWKFALTLKFICQVQHKITQKGQKETTKEGGISLTIMGQKSIYNSIHKPQRQPNETIGFNQDDHLHRMCNETGIPMVVMVT